MSFESQLVNIVHTYIEKVCKQYKLDKAELVALWKGEPVSPIVEKLASETSPAQILKAGKVELVALCKGRGLKCTGTKQDLVNRLLGKATPTPSLEEKPKVQSLLKGKSVAVLKAITTTNIIIRKNSFNRLEHPETGLVFDEETKEVVGTQNSDGTVEQLTDEAIEQCKKYKFKYQIPINLDKKELKNVRVEGLEDDDEIITKVEKEEEMEEEEIVLEDSEEEEEEIEVEED